MEIGDGEHVQLVKFRETRPPRLVATRPAMLWRGSTDD